MLIQPRAPKIASLPVRAFGAVIDGFVVGVPLEIPRRILGNRSLGFQTVLIALSALYLIPQVALVGQTLGCRCVGIGIAAEGTENNPGWARSTARWAPTTIFAIVDRVLVGLSGANVAAGELTGVAVLVVVLYAPALADRNRRTLPDRIAGTVVRLGS